MTRANNEWARYFDRLAPKYLQEPYTRHTQAEVDFLLRELGLPPESHLLDIGCGTGRHAIELAKRGFRITGIDISGGMLREAIRIGGTVASRTAWVQADATSLPLDLAVDGAICLCEGAVGLLGVADDPDTHDQIIISGIHALLKPGARLILTVPNGMAKIRSASVETVAAGDFNPLNLTEDFAVGYQCEGETTNIEVRERGYVPSELRRMLMNSGFVVEGIFGGTAGAWNLVAPELDEMEIMAIAAKAGD